MAALETLERPSGEANFRLVSRLTGRADKMDVHNATGSTGETDDLPRASFPILRSIVN
jgi:hypothetical protein